MSLNTFLSLLEVPSGDAGDDISFLVTQETNGEAECIRLSLAAVVAALRENGINHGYISRDDYVALADQVLALRDSSPLVIIVNQTGGQPFAVTSEFATYETNTTGTQLRAAKTNNKPVIVRVFGLMGQEDDAIVLDSGNIDWICDNATGDVISITAYTSDSTPFHLSVDDVNASQPLLVLHGKMGGSFIPPSPVH